MRLDGGGLISCSSADDPGEEEEVPLKRKRIAGLDKGK